MSKEVNYEVIENEDQKDSLEVTIVEKESFLAKAKNVITKHGKKIVGAVLLAGVGIAGFAIGKNSGSKDESDDYDDLEIIDLDAEDETSTEE